MRVLVGGVVHTMAGGTAEAIAFDRGGIVAVGAREAVLAAAGAGAEVSEVRGRAIVPGFIDAHHHMSIATFYEGCIDLGAARRTRSGRVLHLEEAVTASEALAMYTRNAAKASGCLDVAGTLERGKRADLAVLSADPCAPGADLGRLSIDETILGGETVYSRD